jgi:hypothetical protein
MKKLLLGLLLCGPLAAWSDSTGQDEATMTVTGTAHPAIQLPKHHRTMSPDEFYNYMRDYDLANGQTLSVYARGEKVYASVDGALRHELVASAANTFYARDGQLKVNIDLHGEDDASGVLYMIVPQQNLASGETRPAHIARISW